MKKDKWVTITIDVKVNDNPPSAPMTLVVRDGDWVHVIQPIEAYFQPGGPPIPRVVAR